MITDTRLINNIGHMDGGAAVFQDGTTATLSGFNLFEGNAIAGRPSYDPSNMSALAPAVFAGALLVTKSNVTVSGTCLIQHNRVALNGASGGGLVLASGSRLVAGPGLRVHNNTATGTGTGMLLREGAELHLTGAMIDGNSGAFRGGGLYLQDNSTAALTDCVLAGHGVASAGGGAVVTSTAALSMTNCTVANNTVGTLGAG